MAADLLYFGILWLDLVIILILIVLELCVAMQWLSLYLSPAAKYSTI